MNDFFKQANRLGIFFVILFFMCFVWFYIQPVERELHVRLLRLSFFYFYDMNFMAMVSGALQSYVWGYIGVVSWVLASKISNLLK